MSGFGIALRYQERAPDAPGAAEPAWCETGHSSSSWPGASATRSTTTASRRALATCCTSRPGAAHRHKPSVVGDEVVRYVLTEFELALQRVPKPHRPHAAGGGVAPCCSTACEAAGMACARG